MTTEVAGNSGPVREGKSDSLIPLPVMELPSCARDYSDASISIKFTEDIEIPTRSRIEYSFRVFAAIYGYRVVEPDLQESWICIIYGGSPQSNRATFRDLHLPARYCERNTQRSVSTFSWRRYAGEDFPLFYGVDEQTGNPDWLGEIFQWISSSHERDISNRDSEGRIDYADTVFARRGISPRKPYATMLMSWLDNYLRRGNTIEALPRAPSPAPGIEHTVVCSHDIDFYYTNAVSALLRLLKNLLISFTLYRSRPYFFANARMILALFSGRRIGGYLTPLLSALRNYGVKSTLFAVARKAHRRDPNYLLEDLAAPLLFAIEKGFPVALHGSYQSIVERKVLLPEIQRLHELLGKRPLGNRQHWLRFDTHEDLFEAVKSAALAYDSSLGFPETPGFRNGASFAFPPYDFKNERPYDFLEIPLVLMDGNVESAARRLGESAQDIADHVLSESRRWSWGGIAILWHNPMEPLSVPPGINRVFWNCAHARKQHQEKWISAEEFLGLSLSRYQNAGLMKVPIDA